ncbi:MAG: M24 family metallopeptidase [Actinobacteria bacterium]|nr:M24 family metallopeptidase [Actinomycetota bacterium]
MDDRKLDALLLAGGPNVRWLTGFTGSSGAALVGREWASFITDFRYVEQASDEIGQGFQTVISEGALRRSIAAVVGSNSVQRLGFDSEDLSVDSRDQLEDVLPAEVELVPQKGVSAALRAVKDAAEVEAIQTAATLGDRVLTAVLETGLLGRTEVEIAADLERRARALGAEAMSFPSIVAAGAHGALPHAQPKHEALSSGQLVVIDWGVVVGGYCSDCTRTVALGAVSDHAKEVYEIVLSAQQAGVAALRPGPTGREIDAVSRDLIDDAGFGEHFGHGLGHGVGLEIHEAPTLGKTGDVALEEGMVVTVEPGIYLAGELGIRIEDLLVVTADGANAMTHLPLGLIEVS